MRIPVSSVQLEQKLLRVNLQLGLTLSLLVTLLCISSQIRNLTRMPTPPALTQCRVQNLRLYLLDWRKI